MVVFDEQVLFFGGGKEMKGGLGFRWRAGGCVCGFCEVKGGGRLTSHILAKHFSCLLLARGRVRSEAARRSSVQWVEGWC